MHEYDSVSISECVIVSIIAESWTCAMRGAKRVAHSRCEFCRRNHGRDAMRCDAMRVHDLSYQIQTEIEKTHRIASHRIRP